MRPTIEQVTQWQPGHLQVRADYAETLDNATFAAHRILADGRDTLIDSWDGLTAEVAGDHAHHEMHAVTLVSGAFDELAEVLRRASAAIDGALRVALREIETATRSGFRVTDADGVVPMGPFADAEASTAAQSEAVAHAEAINAALETLGAVDDEQAAAIKEAVDRLRDVVDGPDGVGASEGSLLAEITSDGFITHGDLQRLRAGFDAAGITPEYLERLVRGEEVHDLPPGSVEFLRTYFEEVGVAGFLEVQDALAAHGGQDARVASAQLGDGLLALSNERIGDVSGGRGGFHALPPSIRALPNGEVVHGFPADSPYRGVGTSGFNLSRQALSDTFWGEVGKGIAPPGDELGARLIVGASNHSIFLDEGGEGVRHIFDTDFSGEGLRAENSGQAMLEISARNHESVARVITGDLDGDPSTAPVQRDEILNPLFRREWGDDGAALGKNLSWMTESLGAAPGSEEWKRAGTVSFALAQYLSHEENFDALMDMKGEHSENIGEVSPELVRSMERGLRGTIGYLTEAQLTDLPGWGVADGSAPLPLETDHSTEAHFDHARRVATVLSTDPVSDHALGTEINRLVDAKLQNSTESSANEAGKLVGLNDAAEFMVQKEMADDGGLSAQEVYHKRRASYDFVIDEMSGLGRGPVGGLVEHGVSFGGDAARESIIGPEVTYDPDKNVDVLSDDENSIKALHSAASAAMSSGRLTPDMTSGSHLITDRDGNLIGLQAALESGSRSEIRQQLQDALDRAGTGFGHDRRSDFTDGYSAVRPGTTTS